MFTSERDSRGATYRRRPAAHIVIGLLLLVLVLAETGRATAITDSWSVPFVAPEQSLWVPGNALGFNWAGNVPLSLGLFSLNLNASVSASSGSVWGNVEGLLNVTYEDRVKAGRMPVDINFGGLTNESNISTTLGGSLGLSATFGVDFPIWTLIPDLHWTLGGGTNLAFASHTDFTYQEDVQINGRSQYEPKIAGLGIDALVAGVELTPGVYQNTRFRAGEISGMLEYTHLGTQTTGSVPFTTSDLTLTRLYLPLTLPGYWKLNVRDLKLDSNFFSTELGYTASISAWAALVGSVKWQEDYTVYPSLLFPGGEFALNFNEVDLPGSMLVYVDHAPEPGTIVLLASALLALAARRSYGRRR